MSVVELLNISEVVRRLSRQYPGLTVSKVRFLEEKGLLAPQRTESGYRQFSQADIERLEAILRMQKLYFYPLTVIKAKLEAADRGEDLEELSAFDEEAAENATQMFEGQPQPLESVSGMLDVPAAFIRSLAEYGLISIDKGESGPIIDGKHLVTIQSAARLNEVGVNPRHLRFLVSAADKEAALLSQIVRPLLQANTEESKSAGKEMLAELEKLFGAIDRALLRNSLDEELEGTNKQTIS